MGVAAARMGWRRPKRIGPPAAFWTSDWRRKRRRSRLIKTADRISERPPLGGLSVSAQRVSIWQTLTTPWLQITRQRLTFRPRRYGASSDQRCREPLPMGGTAMKTKLVRAIWTLSLIALSGCLGLITSGRAYADPIPTTIFNDFGRSGPIYCDINTSNCTAYGLSTLAVQFTSPVNSPVKQIDLGLYWTGNLGTTNAATVSLVTDPGGDPATLGTTLASWSLVNLSTTPRASTIVTISGITGVNLKLETISLKSARRNRIAWDGFLTLTECMAR